MKASLADQRLLLDLADLDRRLRQAEAARRNPPQAARVQELVAQRNAQSHELAVRVSARDALKADLARIESDVALAEQRRTRDRDRLGGSASAKDAQALEREIEALTKRLSSLEDGQLEIMERLEAAEGAVVEQEALLAATTADGQRVSAEGRAQAETAVREIDALTRDRTSIAGRLPAALTTAYDRLAERGVIAAALFARGACGGCHVMLAPSDLQALRAVPADEIANCPECGCILVRTEESGL
ncbi:C4-type zinc ribbon domain-containing protein [Microbacterium betulae]|uniref:C4-type zinc ribbon domain-containing protein n=1 Tax=Microbacterium betulae TaxID=2981139 RepID=A0AA97I5F2_9MICO|nr:C4-type zinc ribbon domain-containing protein [Microbacterium sp. AB]WOF21467.1 C4-type zinc ribbon domain-containing protein [Microbacterium sp. AB]